MNSERRVAAVALLLALTLVGCGVGKGDQGSSLTVSAASSLKDAFTQYAEAFSDGEAKLQFAGSHALATQIRQGVRPDIFAAANTELPQELFAAGLVERPIIFAGNRLVIAVGRDAMKVKSLADLSARDITLAIGAAGVPVGDYTAKVLSRLPSVQRAAILNNVRSREPDVGGIVGKLSQGAVDAGFVYITDVEASGGRLKAIELPPALEPHVAYGVAVVKGSAQHKQAETFVAGLLDGGGQRALAGAGFEPPPAGAR